jgi:hypothetical protein
MKVCRSPFLKRDIADQIRLGTLLSLGSQVWLASVGSQLDRPFRVVRRPILSVPPNCFAHLLSTLVATVPKQAILL